MTQEEKQKNAFELEKHVHEQYAINNNANINSFITFLVSLLAIFATYGYVFVFNTGKFAGGTKILFEMQCSQTVFTLDVLLLVTAASVIILTFLAILCIQLGYAHRRDQVMVQEIRKKYPANEDVLSKYDAYGKNWCDFLPNFYNLFVRFFSFLIILLSCATIFRGCNSIKGLSINCGCFCYLLTFGVAILIICIVKCCYYSKYTNLFKEPKNNNIKKCERICCWIVGTILILTPVIMLICKCCCK